MKRRTVGSIAVDAFYDNFTFAALFGRLRIPGAPKETVDPRPANIFWANECQQFIEDLRVELDKIIRLIHAGALSSILSKIVTESLTKDEMLKSFQGSWPSFKAQETVRHPQ